jgi:glycosyltransferase involved in cell wall biosynthesis
LGKKAIQGPLRVALVAPAWFPVPPRGYGGIEAVVHLLATQLKEMGHEVTTFAAEGSDPRLRAVSLAPDDWSEDLGTSMQGVREATYEVRVNRELQKRRHDFDVVHLHTEFPGMACASLPGLDIPRLATVHSGIGEEVVTFLKEIDELIDLVAISKAQREQAPTVRWRAVVHNAVRVDDFEVEDDKDGYLVQLARITPDKGQYLAIEVAERVGMPLVLAGKVDRDAESRRYFTELIEPRLSGKVRWIEDVRGEEKAKLMGRASALIFPIQWEEPFGLAMVEAMASGTPVVAFDRGAARELVEPGITGYLAGSVDELVERVRQVGEIDSRRCAKRARDRFSPRRMAAGYARAYRNSLKKASA